MKKLYKVLFSQTFEDTMMEVIHHHAQFVDETHFLAKLESVIEQFITFVQNDPYMFKTCQQALSLGVNQYREHNKDGLRIIYSVHERNNEVIVHLIAGQKQELTKLLHDYVLIYL